VGAATTLTVTIDDLVGPELGGPLTATRTINIL
jgi:hypothetical protein